MLFQPTSTRVVSLLRTDYLAEFLLYQRIGAERVRDQLQYTDTQYPFDEEV